MQLVMSSCTINKSGDVEMIQKNKTTIRLLMYSARQSSHREKIETLVSELGPKIDPCLFDSSAGFAGAVESSLYGQVILLILLENENDHTQIQGLKDILDGHPLILILPDTEEAVMARGMSLYPRYMSYLKDDYQDVYDVLERMIRKIRYQIKGEEDGPNN